MLKSIIAKIQLLCNEDESCSYRRNALLLFLSPHAATATAPLLDPPIGLINLLLSGLAVLFVPSIHELLLPSFTAFEIIGVESLF